MRLSLTPALSRRRGGQSVCVMAKERVRTSRAGGERPPSPSEGEGRGEGENVRGLASSARAWTLQLFSLTPALSRWEREKVRLRSLHRMRSLLVRREAAPLSQWERAGVREKARATGRAFSGNDFWQPV